MCSRFEIKLFKLHEWPSEIRSIRLHSLESVLNYQKLMITVASVDATSFFFNWRLWNCIFRASLQYGIICLKKLNYDKKVLQERRRACENVNRGTFAVVFVSEFFVQLMSTKNRQMQRENAIPLNAQLCILCSHEPQKSWSKRPSNVFVENRISCSNLKS